MRHLALFPDLTPTSSRALPVLGAQADITYHEANVGRVFNTPAATGMGYWSLNPYVGCAFGCAYCYARYAHRYATERAAATDSLTDSLTGPDDGNGNSDAALGEPVAESMAAAPAGVGGTGAWRAIPPDLPAWLAFERHILVKTAAPAVTRRALRSARGHGVPAPGETVVIGTATDPYQPAERRFRVTRGVLEALAEWPGLHVVIITKSPLVTRDIDVLARLAERGSASVHLTITTIDRELARRLEPRAPTPESRLRALARLRAAGIDAGVNVMPVLPGITDDPAALEALVARIAEAGATFAGACALRLRASARERYLPFVEAEFPHLAARYRRAYAAGHHVGRRYRDGLARTFARLCARHGVPTWGQGRDQGDKATHPDPQQPSGADGGAISVRRLDTQTSLAL